MTDHTGDKRFDKAQEETAVDCAVSLSVEAASERLRELADDVDERLQSVTEAALRAEFERARSRAIRIYECAVLGAGLHDDDPDVIRGLEDVEREAAELWGDIQVHNNVLAQHELQQLQHQGQVKGQQQAAFVAPTDPTSQQETMQRLFESRIISKLAGSTVAPKMTDGASSSTAVGSKSSPCHSRPQ